MHITKLKNSTWKGHIFLCDFNYMTFWKKKNYGDSNKVSGWQGFRWEQKFLEQWKYFAWYYDDGS